MALVDVRTLAFMSCLGGLIMAMTMTGLRLTGTRQDGILFWAGGGLSYGLGYLVGFLLLSFSVATPGWLATALANNLMSLGQILILIGAQRFVGRKAWLWALLLPPVAFASMLHPQIRPFPTPFIIDTVLLTAPCLIAAFYLWHFHARGMAVVQRAAAILMGLMGLFLTGRAIALLAGQSLAGSFDQHALQILAFLIATAYGFLLTMALVLMIFRTRELHLQRVARRDALTGLHNRYALDSISRRELDLARRHGMALSLIALDIDHFKRINDTHGHAGGDLVLQQIAKALQEAFRASDLLFRIGGEEFLVLMPMTRFSEATTAAERLRSSLAARQITGKSRQLIPVTASLGVTEIELMDEDWEAALHRADQALYQAKDQGRNQVVGIRAGKEAGQDINSESRRIPTG